MKRFIYTALVASLLWLPACSSTPEGGGQTTTPEDLIAVRVNNTSGDMVTVGYSFARSGVANLGTVPRGEEGVTFHFPWEPGRLEFAVRTPRSTMSSNGVSSRRGDTFELNVTRRDVRATRVDQASTGPGGP